uniref:Uncharacterized protein n=1 Tax=Coturnix japonica TaxID=93934 RepID=A0A8C2T4P0_COTJA
MRRRETSTLRRMWELSEVTDGTPEHQRMEYSQGLLPCSLCQKEERVRGESCNHQCLISPPTSPCPTPIHPTVPTEHVPHCHIPTDLNTSRDGDSTTSLGSLCPAALWRRNDS